MRKKITAFVLCMILICSGSLTAWAADDEQSVVYDHSQEAELLLTHLENLSQTGTVTGFPESDISERCFYVAKEDKPSLAAFLEELPDTMEVFLNDSDEAVTIPVTYECVGESYEDSDGYYFQFSPVWDESQYPLADGLERIKDAPYYSLFLYDTDGDGVSELSVTGSTNEATVYSFLVNKIGFNSAGACGVMANIQRESSFNPHATGDNGTSYGICQWHNERWTAMKNWCRSNGYDSTTLTGQLNYLKFELSQNNSNYLWNGKTIYNKIKGVANSAQGAYDAGYNWCYYYEIPANKDNVSVTRGNLAKNSYWPEYGKSVAKPTSVSGLKISGRTADVIRLNWNKNTTAEGYIVEQYKNGAWTRIARIGSNSTTTYRVENLSAFTVYKFRVRTFNFNGSTPQYSDYQYINGKTNPLAPTGVKLGGRASNVLRLNWNKNTNAEGYIIEQYKNGAWTRIARIGSNSTVTYRVENLNVSTTYQFRIQSFGFDGSTPLYSDWTYINGKTTPSSVSGVKLGDRAVDALRLNWNKNTSAEGYIIEQYKNGAWTRIARIGSNSTVTYRVENLSASTTYQFRIQSFGFDGSTPLYSGWTYINGKTTPSSVSGVKLGGRASDVLRLNWNKNASAEGYIIEQYKNGAWTRIARIGSNSTVTYRIENLSASTTYKFRIQSFCFDGNIPLYSGWSYVNGKTNPSTMSGVKIGGAAKDALRINWNKNNTSQGYIIEQYKNGKWTRIARIGSNSTTTYRVEKLSAHTTYKFRIQAFNFDGNTPLYGTWSYVDGTTN